MQDIFKALQVFAKGTPQPDDITLLVFEADAESRAAEAELFSAQSLPAKFEEEYVLNRD